MEEHIKNIIEKASKELKYPDITFNKENYINNFTEEISKFLDELHDKEKERFEELIKKVTSFELLDSLVQFIANYNYQNSFSNEHDGIKFILLCAAIESFNNLNKNYSTGSSKRFINFLSKQNDDNKKLIEDKFILKNYSGEQKDIIKLFCKYIYYKRSEFVHEGVHFKFLKEIENKNIENLGYIDYFPQEEIRITLKLTFDEFVKIVLEALYNNLSELIQN